MGKYLLYDYKSFWPHSINEKVITGVHIDSEWRGNMLVIPEGVTHIEHMKVSVWNYVSDKTKERRILARLSSQVEKIVCPKTLRSIETDAFSEFKNLKILILNDGLECISSNAFSKNCNLESVKIPNSLKCIGENAFRGTRFESTYPIDIAHIVILNSYKVNAGMEKIFTYNTKPIYFDHWNRYMLYNIFGKGECFTLYDNIAEFFNEGIVGNGWGVYEVKIAGRINGNKCGSILPIRQISLSEFSNITKEDKDFGRIK